MAPLSSGLPPHAVVSYNTEMPYELPEYSIEEGPRVTAARAVLTHENALWGQRRTGGQAPHLVSVLHETEEKPPMNVFDEICLQRVTAIAQDAVASKWTLTDLQAYVDDTMYGIPHTPEVDLAAIALADARGWLDAWQVPLLSGCQLSDDATGHVSKKGHAMAKAAKGLHDYFTADVTEAELPARRFAVLLMADSSLRNLSVTFSRYVGTDNPFATSRVAENLTAHTEVSLLPEVHLLSGGSLTALERASVRNIDRSPGLD